MQPLIDHARLFGRLCAVRSADYARLAAGQSPQALFITCSDSRVVPALITGARPGELFELRTAGNVVPSHAQGPTSEAATIEFAVSVLGVSHVVICGHSHCGAVGALVRGDDLSGAPLVRAWLTGTIGRDRQALSDGGTGTRSRNAPDPLPGRDRHATPDAGPGAPQDDGIHDGPSDDGAHALADDGPHAPPRPGLPATPDDDPALLGAVQRHVLTQAARLRSYPCVARRLTTGGLRLHAWCYEVHTGAVLAHRPGTDSFAAL